MGAPHGSHYTVFWFFKKPSVTYLLKAASTESELEKICLISFEISIVIYMNIVFNFFSLLNRNLTGN